MVSNMHREDANAYDLKVDTKRLKGESILERRRNRWEGNVRIR